MNDRKVVVERDFVYKGFRCVVVFNCLCFRCGYVAVTDDPNVFKMIAEKGGESTRLTTQQYAVLYVARAGVEQDMKHVDLAMMDLEEAIKLDPSQTEAYLIRGQIYLSQKKKELAKRDFEKAISLGVPQGDLRDLLLQCK